MLSVTRYHDISAGHRVVGHEGKCRHLHGHNYRIHFECVAPTQDDIGRVIDFAVIKSKLCSWVEMYWDHMFLVYDHDPLKEKIIAADISSIVLVPFNPTAENMARFLVLEVGPRALEGTGVTLRSCRIDETRKCSASFTRDDV
jgi:6-pyruvoyltetrahydropterin/6-carboxytetrahydropterin synthase